MLHYALYLSYHSNTELFCLHVFRQAGPTTTGRLLGPKVGNSIKCLSQDTETRYRIGSRQGFTTFRLLARRLYQLSYAAAFFYILSLSPVQKASLPT